jgi:predicted secreted protein
MRKILTPVIIIATLISTTAVSTETVFAQESCTSYYNRCMRMLNALPGDCADIKNVCMRTGKWVWRGVTHGSGLEKK